MKVRLNLVLKYAHIDYRCRVPGTVQYYVILQCSGIWMRTEKPCGWVRDEGMYVKDTCKLIIKPPAGMFTPSLPLSPILYLACPSSLIVVESSQVKSSHSTVQSLFWKLSHLSPFQCTYVTYIHRTPWNHFCYTRHDTLLNRPLPLTVQYCLSRLSPESQNKVSIQKKFFL